MYINTFLLLEYNFKTKDYVKNTKAKVHQLGSLK